MQLPLAVGGEGGALKRICLAAGCASLLLGALFLSACGGDGEGAATATTAAAQPIWPNSPDIRVPKAPPDELVIRDLRKGTGAAVPPITNQAQVEVVALYKSVNIENGEIFEERWDRHHPYETEFDPRLDDAWEQGLPGMRVGGRRELIVPTRMSFDQIPLVYVIELLRLEKPAG